MKKLIFTLICVLSIYHITFAQVEKQIKGEALSADEKKKMEDSLQGWKFGGTGSITFNQAGFKNWAAGGTNAISFLFNLRAYADYKKGKHLWQNWVAAEYGIQISKETTPKVAKNADRWELFSKYGYKIYKPLYMAAYVDLKSQFSKSFIQSATTSKFDSVIAKGGSPMSFEAAIGLDYAPNNKFSLFYSPLAAKIVYVGDKAIAQTGFYGNPITPFSHLKREFGSVLIAQYKQTFWKQNISISSVLKIYKNYLRGNTLSLDSLNTPRELSVSVRESAQHYRRNFDIDWQTTIGLKVNKFLSANVFWQVLYDNDMPIKDRKSGVYGYKAQFRDIIGIGLSYNPNFYKEKGHKAKKI
ncbi:MAG: hypothetical protein RJA25_549 [Bacteroidota bacterium]|jgi:hypothetical protein